MASVREKARAAAEGPPNASGWGTVVGIGVFLTVVLFVPPWPEAFSMPKVLVLTATAFACLPLIWTRRAALLAQRVPLLLGFGFVVFVGLSQVLSGAPQEISLWGAWGRRSGSLTAISLCLLAAGAMVLSRREVRTVLIWVVWSGVPATIYGLVQLIGRDPFQWTDQGWIVSTFGNPNFAAAGLSILALLTAGLALQSDFAALPWRVAMAPLAALEALIALATGSSQAIFALGVGAVAGAVAWLLRWDDPRRAKALLGITAATALGFVLSLMALFGIGPLVPLTSPETLYFRTWYWGAAINMATSHPLFGVGPDGYGRFYGEYRPFSALEMPTVGSDAAHDVPLQWASTLGIPAGLLYVGLMVAVAVIVVRRLWLQGPSASSLAVPLLAGWGAYQIQSLVSIDALSIAALGWLLTGLVLGASAAKDAQNRAGIGAWVSAGALGVMGIVVWLPALVASNASESVVRESTQQNVFEAISLVGGTTLPCDPSVKVAQWMVKVAPSEQTVNGVFAGAEDDNRCYGLINAAADFAVQLKQADNALAFAQQGVKIDPLNYSQWILLAKAQHVAGNDQEAVNSLKRALELSPSAAGDVEQAAKDMALSWPPA